VIHQKWMGIFAGMAAAPTLLCADSASPAAKPLGGGLVGVLPWVLIFVVFYFLLIRPQQKQAQQQKKMIDALKKGDRILTQGGFYATVSAVKGKVLEVKLNDEVKVLVAKSAVSQVVAGDPAQDIETPKPAVS